MNKIRITSIQRGCVYDGPGVRTTVFLKGCSLHCPWCCNPETISQKQQWFCDDSKCLLKNGIESNLCQNCIRCGGESKEQNCPFGVLTPVSEEIGAKQLIELLLKDKELYGESGGVTFSGGEPLLQAEDLLPVLQVLGKADVNIAFESTLYAPSKKLMIILSQANTMIVDLKLQREQGSIPAYLSKISVNLELLNEYDINIQYRLVFVDSLIDDKEKVIDQLSCLGVKRIELLKCHNLGSKKYQKLKMKNVDYTADENLMQKFASFLSSRNIEVNILKV